PDAESLKQHTLTLGKPGPGGSTPLLVEVEFRRDEAGFVATLRTSGRSQGRRELSAAGPSCDALAHATSVVLVVLLDLLPPDEPALPRPSEVPPSRATIAEKSELFEYFALGARAGVEYGVFGRALSASFGGGVRVRLARVELALAGFSAPGR